ncbi:MAG: ABC transporter permease [Pirellulaceae bacterium]
MKLTKYIWRNITRNKVRSLLTILSVGFSLALMTVLYGYLAMQDQWGIEAAKNNRIVVMNTQGFAGDVPIAYVDRVRAMPDVKAAVPYSWFGGNFGEEQMPFAQFATDPESVFDVWDEYKIDPDQLMAFKENRQGCVADEKLAQRRGWKIGERIRLKGTFMPVDMDLTLVGTFKAPQNTDSLWFSWTYLDESLKAISEIGPGNAGTIFAKVNNASRMAELSQAIDERFASSDNPTRTQTEAAFAQMFTDMLGNVQAYIRVIALAVVFALALVTGNAMAMSMRERTTEVAVLKAIGFSNRRVLFLVLGEASLIAMFGGALGIGMGSFCIESLHRLSPQIFPLSIVEMAGPWLIFIFAVSAGIGFVSGLVPAIRSAQLSVIDGLRRVI